MGRGPNMDGFRRGLALGVTCGAIIGGAGSYYAESIGDKLVERLDPRALIGDLGDSSTSRIQSLVGGTAVRRSGPKQLELGIGSDSDGNVQTSYASTRSPESFFEATGSSRKPKRRAQRQPLPEPKIVSTVDMCRPPVERPSTDCVDPDNTPANLVIFSHPDYTYYPNGKPHISLSALVLPSKLVNNEGSEADNQVVEVDNTVIVKGLGDPKVRGVSDMLHPGPLYGGRNDLSPQKKERYWNTTVRIADATDSIQTIVHGHGENSRDQSWAAPSKQRLIANMPAIVRKVVKQYNEDIKIAKNNLESGSMGAGESAIVMARYPNRYNGGIYLTDPYYNLLDVYNPPDGRKRSGALSRRKIITRPTTLANLRASMDGEIGKPHDNPQAYRVRSPKFWINKAQIKDLCRKEIILSVATNDGTMPNYHSENIAKAVANKCGYSWQANQVITVAGERRILRQTNRGEYGGRLSMSYNSGGHTYGFLKFKGGAEPASWFMELAKRSRDNSPLQQG